MRSLLLITHLGNLYCLVMISARIFTSRVIHMDGEKRKRGTCDFERRLRTSVLNTKHGLRMR